MQTSSTKAPDAFRTISEVARDLDVPQHVLRFWESKFPNEIKPLKRSGGRRYYRPEDVSQLHGIKHMLYTQGLTIKGAQKVLREHRFPIKRVSTQERNQATPSPAMVASAAPAVALAPVELPAVSPPSASLSPQMRQELVHLLDDLKSLRALLKQAGV